MIFGKGIAYIVLGAPTEEVSSKTSQYARIAPL